MGTRPRAGRRPDFGQDQERVPGQHEPRNPHAHERHHRHVGPVDGHQAQRGAAGVRAHRADLRRFAADDHQRHPRFLEDRSGQADVRDARFRHPAGGRIHHRNPRRTRPEQEPGTRQPHPGRGAARSLRRRRTPAPGVAQPAFQRREVHRKGEVALYVRTEEVTPESVQLLFEVVDTGIGLSEEAQARVFQPFAQADGSTTRKYGGTGLGLAISRGLVERMDGQMGIRSEPGAGSTFGSRPNSRSSRSRPAVRGGRRPRA